MITIDLDISKLSSERYQLDPAKYLLTEDLQSTVNVAITLGFPLLITGDPGTGKTQLAYKIAYDLKKKNHNFCEKPIIFNTKSTSTATDLFYQYDAIRHFHDASIKKESQEKAPSILNYITFHALGEAIVLSNIDKIEEKYRQCLLASKKYDNIPKSSIVLIDEIDKAPRDFPNDLLNEIEYLQFRIKEDNNSEIRKGCDQKIIIIITSNSEKNLPDAFLRRCVFYHIPFPPKEILREIVLNHLGKETKYANEDLIRFFIDIRDSLVKKKPNIAELIAWLRILELTDFINDEKLDLANLDERQRKILNISYSVLAKTRDDRKKLDEMNHKC